MPCGVGCLDGRIHFSPSTLQVLTESSDPEKPIFSWSMPAKFYAKPGRLLIFGTCLAAGTTRKGDTFLQLLKETGARCGEALQLNWIDFDFENKTVRITPEKGSDPRQLKISDKLIAMLNNLPKENNDVFKKGRENVFHRTFRQQRKRIAIKLQNERIRKITFHTFRHWKATTEYAKTKDILRVMKMLGHKSIQNTLL